MAASVGQEWTQVTVIVIACAVFTLLVSLALAASLFFRWRKKTRMGTPSTGEQTSAGPQEARDLEAGVHVEAPSEADAEAAETTAEILSIAHIEGNCAGESEEREHSESNDCCFTSMDLKGIVELGVEEQWYIFEDQVKLDSSDALKGAFASVRSGMLFGDQQVAVKVPNSFRNDLSGAMALANEIRLYRRIRHPNIVLCYGVTILKVPLPLPCLVLEWVDGGNLSTFVSTRRSCGEFQRDCKEVFSDDLARGDLQNLKLLHETKLLIDVTWGMHYLHSQKPAILHMDLKPQNILIQGSDPPSAKLADFGLAMLLDQDVRRSNVGTVRYMAPEVQQNKPYNKPAEVYSFGLTVAFTISGQPPPKARNSSSLPVLHRQMVQMLQVPHLPRELVKICTKCLSPKPSSRPSFAELVIRMGGAGDSQNSAKSVRCSQQISQIHKMLHGSSGDKNQIHCTSTVCSSGTSWSSDSSVSLSWSDRELSVHSNLSGARIDKIAKNPRVSSPKVQFEEGGHSGSERSDQKPKKQKKRNNRTDGVLISL